jgi:hypothetical protein
MDRGVRPSLSSVLAVLAVAAAAFTGVVTAGGTPAVRSANGTAGAGETLKGMPGLMTHVAATSLPRPVAFH